MVPAFLLANSWSFKRLDVNKRFYRSGMRPSELWGMDYRVWGFRVCGLRYTACKCILITDIARPSPAIISPWPIVLGLRLCSLDMF